MVSRLGLELGLVWGLGHDTEKDYVPQIPCSHKDTVYQRRREGFYFTKVKKIRIFQNKLGRKIISRIVHKSEYDFRVN